MYLTLGQHREKIVFIAEMLVEGSAAHARSVAYLVDSDVFESLFGKKRGKRTEKLFSCFDYSCILVFFFDSRHFSVVLDLKDLLNKNAKLSFEKEKIINDEIYAYVYINETISYNEKIIESGLAKLNIDNKLSYKNDLIQAQAYAKQLALGVWKR